ncbi:MAG: MFS transporter [Candidatus Bathyarchaeota archaeon]|nr:MFS transporter [Candidatus Bathyarchaeota archaeon]MCX8177903.1 MFS transporter [Candidatus Bathyarchaeota archaeon]MDW8194275.1 MFS transporter [Nitrososphaerota archaeon]
MENAVGGTDFAASLRVLLVSCFLMQLLIGVVGITVPIYAAGLGASPLFLGIIGATGGFIYSFMPFVSGVLSDRIKRSIFIFASIFLYGLANVLYFLAESPLMLLPIKALEWISVAMFWPSAEALLTDSSGEKLEVNLRKFNLSWSSGTIAGPIIGGMLISLAGIKTPFALSSVSAFALSLLVLAKIKEAASKKISNQGGFNRYDNGRAPFTMAVMAVILFSFISGVIYNIFPAHATSLGIPAHEVGLILLANGLFRMVAFTEAYRIEAKIGMSNIFLIGSLVIASASAMSLISSTTLMFFSAFSIFGLGMGLLYAASIAHILKGWGSAKGHAAGIFESFIGIGNLLGSSTGGLISEYIALNAPYMLIFAASLALVIYQASHMLRRKHVHQGSMRNTLNRRCF